MVWRFGYRFIEMLRPELVPDGDAFLLLTIETSDVFLEWLEGATLTGSADEPSRRAAAAVDFLRRSVPLSEGKESRNGERAAATAILELPPEHPGREVDRACDVLLQHWSHLRGDQEEEQLATIAILLTPGPLDAWFRVCCTRSRSGRNDHGAGSSRYQAVPVFPVRVAS